MKKDQNYKLYSSSGGFYTARYVENGYVYWVQNDTPSCLTKSKECGDQTFMEENIVYEIVSGTDVFPSKHDERIYKKLYKVLADADVIIDY